MMERDEEIKKFYYEIKWKGEIRKQILVIQKEIRTNSSKQKKIVNKCILKV